MKHAFLFDIDGVLCEPQQPAPWELLNHIDMMNSFVFLVTGNSFTKSKDLLDPKFRPNGIFCNMADEMRDHAGNLVWQDTETPPLPDMQWFLCQYDEADVFNNSIEWRSPRFVNFCPRGRYATKEQRDIYMTAFPQWRERFIREFEKEFPGVEAVIGGQVSVDIYSKGADKSRAGKWLNDNGYTFTFIGDKTAPGGNDYPLAEYCRLHPENKCLTSTGPKHTLELIDEELNG